MIDSRVNLPAQAAEPPPFEMPYSLAEEDSSGAGFSIPQLWHMVRANLWLSIGSFALIAAVALFMIKGMPKSYSASATLIVNNENIADPLAGRYWIGSGSFFSTQVELIYNNVMLQPVIDRLDLKNDVRFTGESDGDQDPKVLNASLLNRLRSAINVEPGRGSQLLYISATASDPGLAAELANGVADEYIRQTTNRINTPAVERADRYDAQLAELKERVGLAQGKWVAFQQRHLMSDIKDGRGGVLESNALENLQGQRVAAENAVRELEAKRVDPNTSSAEVLEAEETLTLRDKLGELEGELGRARATLGAKHPRMQSLQSEIDATRSALQTAVRARNDSQTLALARARDFKARLEAAVAAERQRLLSRTDVQEEGSKLLLELRLAEEAYAGALRGRDQVQFASQGQYKDVALVSPAEPPMNANRSNRRKQFMMAVLFGFAVSVGGPFAYELFLNRRIRCRDDLERSFGIVTLAHFGPMTPTPAAT